MDPPTIIELDDRLLGVTGALARWAGDGAEAVPIKAVVAYEFLDAQGSRRMGVYCTQSTTLWDRAGIASLLHAQINAEMWSRMMMASEEDEED